MALSCLAATPLQAQSAAELQQRIVELEKQLAEAQSQLAVARDTNASAEQLEEAEATLAQANDLGPRKISLNDPWGGTLNIGGAIRANYYVGDYNDPRAGAGGGDGTSADTGTISLDLFRVNLDYANGQFLAKGEYRFYPGYLGGNSDSYQMFHTGWLGWQFDADTQVQVGLNRVPFGPGPYGVSQSWFFDQHYYVGLADDMDVGLKFLTQWDDLQIALGYYIGAEQSWVGENFSNDSVRYSYDIVDETGNGYTESHQFNARVIKPISLTSDLTTDLGASVQFGLLESEGAQDDGTHFAASGHAVTQYNNWKLATQFTYYNIGVDDQQPLGTDDLVQFGAFDFPTTVATEAFIPAVSLSYYYETNDIAWLDYVIPYAEYSSIMKTEDTFNDSDMMTLGAAWGRGGWYIYTEGVWSNGNDFIGNQGGFASRFGANPNDRWLFRFNVNFGYYF